MTFLSSITRCATQCTLTTAALATGTALTGAALIALRCTSSKREAIDQLGKDAVSLSFVSEARKAVKDSIAVANAAIAAIGKNDEALKGQFEAAKKALTEAKTAETAHAAVERLIALIENQQSASYKKDGEDVGIFTPKQVAGWLGVAPVAKTASAAAVEGSGLRQALADIAKGVTQLNAKVGGFKTRDQDAQGTKATLNQKYGLQSPRREEIAFGIAALVSFCVAGGLWYTGTPVWTPAAPVVGVKA